MTKDEMIAALQADPSPGNTPVVRAVGGVYLEIRAVEPVRRQRHGQHEQCFISEDLPPPYGTLTLTLF